MHTINADDKQEDTHRTIEAKIDADLHEFSFEERKFFVRLNQFNGVRVLQGYLKKLCHEGSMFFSQSFEMRFCVMDMHDMCFKYAKSPKEEFGFIDMEELVSCNFEDPKRTKPIKVKKDQQGDLKYLLYLIGRKRTYVLSANTRSDQVMWFNGFQVFFKVKHVINLVKNGAAFSKQSLQMLEEARQKEALRSKSVPPTRKKDDALDKAAQKVNLDKDGNIKATKNIQLKGKLGAKTERKEETKEETKEKVEPKKVYYRNDSRKVETNIKTDDGQMVTKRGNSTNKMKVIPSLDLKKFEEKQEEKKATLEAEQLKTKESDKQIDDEDQAQTKKINRAQKILQANFLKAAQLDDPNQREKTMSRLFALQADVNKGLSLDVVAKLTEDLPYQVTSPQQMLSKVKQEAAAKQKINETQLELAKVAEERKQKQEEIERAKKQIEAIKRQQSMKSAQAIEVEEDSDYDYEYDSETIEHDKQSPAQQTATKLKAAQNNYDSQPPAIQVVSYPEQNSQIILNKPKNVAQAAQSKLIETVPSKSSIDALKASPKRVMIDTTNNHVKEVAHHSIDLSQQQLQLNNRYKKQPQSFLQAKSALQAETTIVTNKQQLTQSLNQPSLHQPKALLGQNPAPMTCSIVKPSHSRQESFDPTKPFAAPSIQPKAPQLELKPASAISTAQNQSNIIGSQNFPQHPKDQTAAPYPNENSQIYLNRYSNSQAQTPITKSPRQQNQSLKKDENVIDMLQSLQTIQVDDEDDYIDQQKPQPSQSAMLQVPVARRADAAIISIDPSRASQSIDNQHTNSQRSSRLNLNVDRSYVNNHQDQSCHSQFSDLSDSGGPAFIIKPFEQSTEQVQADEQTEVKAYDPIESYDHNDQKLMQEDIQQILPAQKQSQSQLTSTQNNFVDSPPIFKNFTKSPQQQQNAYNHNNFDNHDQVDAKKPMITHVVNGTNNYMMEQQNLPTERFRSKGHQDTSHHHIQQVEQIQQFSPIKDQQQPQVAAFNQSSFQQQPLQSAQPPLQQLESEDQKMPNTSTSHKTQIDVQPKTQQNFYQPQISNEQQPSWQESFTQPHQSEQIKQQCEQQANDHVSQQPYQGESVDHNHHYVQQPSIAVESEPITVIQNSGNSNKAKKRRVKQQSSPRKDKRDGEETQDQYLPKKPITNSFTISEPQVQVQAPMTSQLQPEQQERVTTDMPKEYPTSPKRVKKQAANQMIEQPVQIIKAHSPKERYQQSQDESDVMQNSSPEQSRSRSRKRPRLLVEESQNNPDYEEQKGYQTVVSKVSKKEKKFQNGRKIEIHNMIQQQKPVQSAKTEVKSCVVQEEQVDKVEVNEQINPSQQVQEILKPASQIQTKKIPDSGPLSKREARQSTEESQKTCQSIEAKTKSHQEPNQSSSPEIVVTKPAETSGPDIRRISYKRHNNQQQARNKKIESENEPLRVDNAYGDYSQNQQLNEQSSPIQVALTDKNGNFQTKTSLVQMNNMRIPNSSRNNEFESNLLKNSFATETQTQNTTAVINQKSLLNKRRLHITRQSNPQENSVLDPKLNTSQGNTTQMNISSNYGANETGEQIELSQEYLNARRFMRKNKITNTGESSGLRSSQRILKVVNIIGSNRENNQSAKRVSVIRAKHYKSRGEKIAFKHTGSREQLLSSQELVRASGFTQVRLGPVEASDYANTNQNGRSSMLSAANDLGIVSSQARKNNMLLLSNARGNVNQKPQTCTSFYPTTQTDTNNLNLLLDEMDKKSRVSDENPFSLGSNSPKEEMRNSGLPHPVLLTGQGDKMGNISMFPKDNVTPQNNNDSGLLMQRQQSLSKTNEIFKRTTNQSFNTNDALSPSNGEGSLNQSAAYGVREVSTMNFDEVVNQQRDPYILEKMQQQHRLSMHRKNSKDRQSIESQKRSQREESIKAQREIRKKLALQQQQAEKLQNGGHGHFQRSNHKRIPTSTSQGRPPSNLAVLRERSRLADAQGQFTNDLSSNVGLSDMFYVGNQRPVTQQSFQQSNKPIIDFHRASSTGQDNSVVQKKEDDCDADSHFSEEW